MGSTVAVDVERVWPSVSSTGPTETPSSSEDVKHGGAESVRLVTWNVHSFGSGKGLSWANRTNYSHSNPTSTTSSSTPSTIAATAVAPVEWPIRSVLQRLNPDIICLNEANHYDTPSSRNGSTNNGTMLDEYRSSRSALERLAQELGMQFVFASADWEGFGNAILGNYTLILA
jgi:hypothetical protein